MAVTSLWRVKDNIGRVIRYAENEAKTLAPCDSTAETIGEVIDYAARGDATDMQRLVSGINCSPENAKEEMRAVKEFYKKTGGTLAYHGYQSFAEGEVSPEQAHEIGKELAERLWGDRHQVLVATHVDKASHIHNHFVINTVSFLDGRKYHRTKQDYLDMQNASDELCREHGLSVVKHPEKQTGKHYAEWKAEKEGKPTMRGRIREDIDRAVKAAVTFTQFCSTMRSMGYELKLYTDNGEELRRPSLRPEDSQRFYRFDSLGKGYGYDSIIDRILSNIVRTDPFPEVEQRMTESYRNEHPKHTRAKGIAALYYHYCYMLHIIKESPGSARKVSQTMREDLVKLEQLDEQTRFLAAKGIESMEDLNSYRDDASGRIEMLEAERKELRNGLRSAVRAIKDPEDLAAVSRAEGIRSLVNQKTEEIAALRKNIKICGRIEERASRIWGEMETLQNAEKPEGKHPERQRDERKR